MLILLIIGISLIIYYFYHLNTIKQSIIESNKQQIQQLTQPKFEQQLNQYFQLVNLREPIERLGSFFHQMFEDATPAYGGFRYGDNPPDYF